MRRQNSAKATAKAPAKTKWKAKGSTQDLEVEESDTKATTSVEEPQDEVITSPILLEPSTGPKYDVMFMLRMKHAATEALVAPDGKPLSWSFSERLRVCEEQEGKTPGARRALREHKKAEKALRNSTSNLEDVSEEAAAPETPNSAAKRLSLAQEITRGPSAPSPSSSAWPSGMHEAMMTYLNSMAFATPYMPQMATPGYTTVMLRNIPNRYSREMLVERLNKGYQGQYDFVYLPIDFNSKCNVGYAFINFRTPHVALGFIQEFNGAKTKNVLPGFSSAKICEVSYARVQGGLANMENLRDEKFIEKLSERPEWQPLFYDDAGHEIPFSKTLGSGGKKKGRPSIGGGTPSAAHAPMTPTGYMMPTPYGPMMYPSFATPLPAPAMTLIGVLPLATAVTMLMLRNIPTSWDRVKLIEFLNKSYKGSYDFLFVPGDVKSEGNRGFMFINFRKASKAHEFTKECHGTTTSKFFGVEASEDDKVCDIQNARIQSIEKSIERLQSLAPPLSNMGTAAWLPLLFDPQGEPAPFPLLAAPTGMPRMTAGTPSGSASLGALRPVPAKAVDVRALEKKLKSEEGAEATEATAASSADAEGEAAPATPSTPSGQKGKPSPPSSGALSSTGAPVAPGTPGMPGYPGMGYPAGYPGGYPANYAGAYAAAMMSPAAAQYARAYSAVQAAHLHAHAAAAKHAGIHDPAGTPKAPPARIEGTPLTDEQNDALRKQIEFYFSMQNLCKDLYLRRHMDTSGWTPLELIAAFPQVKKYKANLSEIAAVLADSSILEVDSVTRYMRLKNMDERTKWARAPTETESPTATTDSPATSLAPAPPPPGPAGWHRRYGGPPPPPKGQHA